MSDETRINVNFDDVPEVIPPIPSGRYTVRVKSVEKAPTADEAGTNIKFAFQIVDEGQYKNRMLGDIICDKLDSWQTTLLQAAKCFGVTTGASGLDLKDFVEKTGIVETKIRSYVPKGEDVAVEVAAIRKYVKA